MVHASRHQQHGFLATMACCKDLQGNDFSTLWSTQVSCFSTTSTSHIHSLHAAARVLSLSSAHILSLQAAPHMHSLSSAHILSLPDRPANGSRRRISSRIHSTSRAHMRSLEPFHIHFLKLGHILSLSQKHSTTRAHIHSLKAPLSPYDHIFNISRTHVHSLEHIHSLEHMHSREPASIVSLTYQTHSTGKAGSHSLQTSHPIDLAHLLSLPDQAANYAVFVSLLNHYRKSKVLSEGRLVHILTCHHGYHRATFISNCLIEMYGNCGSVEDARAVFAALRKPDMYSWHIMIKAYGQNGHVDDAYAAFTQMSWRNDVSWNTMISVFAQNGHGRRALDLFREMQIQDTKPNRVTFVSLLDACADVAALEEGLEIHSLLDVGRNEVDVVIGTALITMYGKCGAVGEARNVFDRMLDRDVVSWTAMIAAFSQNGHGKEALDHFCQMQHKGFKPDIAAFICAIDACASLGQLKEGQAIHVAIVDIGYEDRAGMGNALIHMYGKCKSLCDAKDVFLKMSNRDVVSWTAVIGACAQNADGKEGLKLYNQMKVEGVMPNKVTFLCALDACAITAGIASGQEIHASIYNFGYHGDVMMGNTLINMYGKCGSLFDARRVFNNMRQRDVVCYTSMIATLSQTGHIKEALDLLKQMEQEGIKPNDVTFVCTLNACSHTGQINAAREFFYSMNQNHGLPYREDHYVCMIDLLGRAGHLDEAEDLIAHIPAEKATVAWLCLLGACKIHGDAERAARATSHCHELDPNDVTPFVTLTNILSSSKVAVLHELAKRHDSREQHILGSSDLDRNFDYSYPQNTLHMEEGLMQVGSEAVGSG